MKSGWLNKSQYPVVSYLIFLHSCPGPEPEDAENYRCPSDTTQLDDIDTLPAVSKDELAFRNLVLRRGLALALMLFILAAGIILNLLITNLATWLWVFCTQSNNFLAVRAQHMVKVRTAAQKQGRIRGTYELEAEQAGRLRVCYPSGYYSVISLSCGCAHVCITATKRGESS